MVYHEPKETKMITKNTVTDELVNKIYHLSKALTQAQSIISTFEQENKRLLDVLNGLTSDNNESYILDSEAFNEPVYTV